MRPPLAAATILSSPEAAVIPAPAKSEAMLVRVRTFKSPVSLRVTKNSPAGSAAVPMFAKLTTEPTTPRLPVTSRAPPKRTFPTFSRTPEPDKLRCPAMSLFASKTIALEPAATPAVTPSITPNIPVVSEETVENKNSDLDTFWLVDPIDGTYDYLNNKDEFTINAGLIINKQAIAGIIYAPAKNRMFYTCGDNLSFELKNNTPFLLNNKNIDKNNIKAVSYSDHLKQEIIEIHNKLNVKEYVRMKSSLKFCVIATGEYQVYVAEPRAREWDIAAGHAILKNSGGVISDFDGNEILYGKSDFKNPSIILRATEKI